MVSDKSVANAVGGKTARACDSCIRKRARWYCAADDAFLCQSCDASVHSANSLARRHERVRLKTASFKIEIPDEAFVPSWHKGFTRKARTPRQGKPALLQRRKSDESRRNNNPPAPLVPELGVDETSHEEIEDQELLYRVPTYDPFVADQLCASGASDANRSKSKTSSPEYDHDAENLHGLLQSDMDIAEFAADVESLLGRGLENETFGMEGLGLINCEEKKTRECCLGDSRVKLEQREDEEDVGVGGAATCHGDTEIDITKETFELSFDYDSAATCAEEDEKPAAVTEHSVPGDEGVDAKCETKKVSLKLDYEAVISAWSSHGTPWFTGNRPELNPNDCWPDNPGAYGAGFPYAYKVGTYAAAADGGREARVSRYREKRRTRLFSKKIRYEVRKLNAEKRPRMKGRFVKRASFALASAAAPSFPLLTK